MSDVAKAIQHICDEKGLEYDVVLEAIQTALGAAYRKDFGSRQGNYKVKFSVETGDIQVWDVKEVVDDVDEEQLEKLGKSIWQYAKRNLKNNPIKFNDDDYLNISRNNIIDIFSINFYRIITES